jgi:hypothetical protein
VVVAGLLSWWHQDDLATASDLRDDYWWGTDARRIPDMQEAWSAFADREEGVDLVRCQGPPAIDVEIPFVYAPAKAFASLRADLESFGLVRQRRSAGEWTEMLAASRWLGGAWDHGDDPLPPGVNRLDTRELLIAGRHGAKYWCEIAATSLVQIANSQDWIARLVTLSRDGYAWEHAVAELWSHEYGKWFVADADFNVRFESEGVPLSAYELCHEGPRLQEEERLEVIPLGPSKPSLPYEDLVPYFRYVFIDLRNDWAARTLPRGSPAGGERATWWTAREGAPDILTARVRVDDRALFDWPVNVSWILPVTVEEDSLTIRIGAYGPDARSVEYRFDEGDWRRATSRDVRVPWPLETLTAEARVSRHDAYGPVASVILRRSP